MQKPLHGGAEWIGDRIYCSAEDVESGAYREALTCASYDFTPQEHWWKTKSLAAYLFGRTADEEALRAYYTQSEDMDILSLFPAYFTDAFASEEELYLANDTALSLTAYTVGKYGIDEFFQGSSDYRQEWLTTLGVNREYLDPYAETFAGYSYSSSPDYPLIVTTEKQDEFYLSPLPGDMDTPKSVREFFYFIKKGMAAILAGVEKDAPEYYQTLSDNYAAPIRYYLGVRNITISHGSWEARRIDQSVRWSVFHETIHVIVPQYVVIYDDVWCHEGLANYLPYTYAAAELSQLGGPQSQGAFEILYGDNSGLEAYADFLDDYRETYFSYAGKPNTPRDVNFAWVDTSWFYTSLKYPQYQDALLTPIPHNELSYEGAYLLTKYLADKYSLSTVFRYCLSPYKVAFEDMYDISYEKAKAAWMKETFDQIRNQRK
ncbi:MAG TPA: hypothetical protein VN512_04435 [Clostridia bacterium]|nr:hypothetical protein [Clostridia bacterium]